MDNIIEQQLEQFLVGIRSKALAFAVFRIKDEEVALDLVQDAMMGFVKSAEKFETETWTNLFYKILTRRIIDWQKKQQWRSRLRHILPFSKLSESEQRDMEACGLAESDSNPVESSLISDELSDRFEAVLLALPSRQQEAYLLRRWQDLSIQQTATIMQCSEASVKTHFFRAMQTLKTQLGEWINET